MTTSGTTDFANTASMGELTLYSFGLCGIRPAEILQEHMFSARMATNLMLGRWASQQVPLWKVDQITVPLVEGQSTYAVPGNTIAMLDTFVTIQSEGTFLQNRIMTPITRSEWASYPNPTMPGTPSVYWFDRLISPTVTIWPVPDGNEVSISYYRTSQIQDANFTNGQTLDVQQYFLEAFALGLAYRLAATWAADRAIGLKALADEAWEIATNQNAEQGFFYVSPGVQSYWRA